MAEFTLNGRTKVKTLKANFKENFGSTLRVYKSASCKGGFADDDATLASIRAEGCKGGDLVVKGNMQVGNFEKKVAELYGIGVQVANADDTALADNSVTLVAAGKSEDLITTLKKRYDEVYDDGEIYTVCLKKKWGFVSKDGKELISPRFDGLGNTFVEDMITTFDYSAKGGIGFVNKKGKEVVPPKYPVTRDFCGGMAAVYKDKKWGFINKSGKEVVPLIYDSVENFKGTKAKVVLKGKEMFIDKAGKCVK